MNDHSDTILILMGSLLVLVPTLFFSIRKELHQRKMSPEERRVKDARKSAWLRRNSFSAVMYKIGLLLIHICLLGHIAIQSIEMNHRFDRRRKYKNQIVIYRTNINADNHLSLYLYNGIGKKIQVHVASHHPESLFIEQLEKTGWVRIQDSLSIKETHTLSYSDVSRHDFHIQPKAKIFRVGVPWQCKETGESGIAWSSQIDPPKRK